MDEVTFANGETYECSFLSTIDNNIAFIALANVTFAEAFSIFNNTQMTSSIRYGDNLLVGYTELISVSVQPYGIQARLRGGHVEQIV